MGSTESEYLPIRSISINGAGLENYSIAVPDTDKYRLTAMYAARYFKYYAGYELPVVKTGEQTGNVIELGPHGKEYGEFETEGYFEGGNLYLGAKNPTFSFQILDRFFADCLSEKGNIKLCFSEKETFYHRDGLDWEKVPAFLTLQDKIVRSSMKIQSFLEYDHFHGNYYTYQHHGWDNNITVAREKDNRVTNCVIVMNWVLTDIGLFSKGILNHLYNGTVGYTCSSDECKEAMLGGNFDIIETDKSIEQLRSEGGLLPGDIIFYLDINADHNQIVLDPVTAIDGGRGNCEVCAVGAKFLAFVAENHYSSARVGMIFRAKDAR